MEKFGYLFETIDFFVKTATMTMPEAYHLLGVPQQASKEEIQKAYKRKVLMTHPDINPSPQAHHQMVELNAARDVLLFPKQKPSFLHEEKSYSNEVGTNYAMKKKLQKGEAIDVRTIGAEVKPGLYKLDDFDQSMETDYCDALKQLWIVSIGRDKETGEVWADTEGNFFGNPKYECLWLR